MVQNDILKYLRQNINMNKRFKNCITGTTSRVIRFLTLYKTHIIIIQLAYNITAIYLGWDGELNINSITSYTNTVTEMTKPHRL